jgi:hypothetical protein
MKKTNEPKPLTVKEVISSAKEMMKDVARADDEVLKLVNLIEQNASSIRANSNAANDELVYCRFDVHVDCVHGSNEGYYADIVLDGRWKPSQKAGTRERMEIFSVRTMDESMSGCMKAAQYAACLAFFVQKFIDSNMDRFAAANDNFVAARYVSIWDGGRTECSSECVVDLLKHEVVSITPCETLDAEEVEVLDAERVIVPDAYADNGWRLYPVYVRGEEPSSQEADRNTYFLRD